MFIPYTPDVLYLYNNNTKQNRDNGAYHMDYYNDINIF